MFLDTFFNPVDADTGKHLLGELQLALDADDRETVVRVLNTPGLSHRLRSMVGACKKPEELAVWNTVKRAGKIADIDAGAEFWGWYGAMRPYRFKHIGSMVAAHRKASEAARLLNDEDTLLVMNLIIAQQLTSLISNLKLPLVAWAVCHGIVAIYGMRPDLLDKHYTAQVNLLQSQYGTAVHARRPKLSWVNYKSIYWEQVRMAMELQYWENFSAALRELGLITAEEGDMMEAPKLLREAALVAHEHGYTWHRNQALDALDHLGMPRPKSLAHIKT